MGDDFFDATFELVAHGHPKSVVEAAALGIDTRKTGALIKLLRRLEEPLLYFFPSPVAMDFATGVLEASAKLGYDDTKIASFAEFEIDDWNRDDTGYVTRIRADFFGPVVVIGLLLRSGQQAFHRLPGDLAKALAVDLIDAHEKGELIDLRKQHDPGPLQ